MCELVSAALGMYGPLLYGQLRPLDLGTGTLKKQSSQDKPTSGIVRHTVSSLTSLLASLSHYYYGRPLDFGGSLRQEGTLIKFPYLWEVPRGLKCLFSYSVPRPKPGCTTLALSSTGRCSEQVTVSWK